LPVGETVWFLFATSVGAGCGNRSTKLFNEVKGKRVGREADTEGTGCGLETFVDVVEASGDDGNGAGEEVGIEIIRDGVNLDIVLGHRVAGHSDCYLAVTIAFIGEESADGLMIRGVGGETIAGLGGVDN
jgi:hypothetical protein